MLLLAAWLALVSPARAQNSNGISEPAPGDTISGVVLIRGTATHPDFLRYEVAFFREANPVGWISFAEGDQQVIEDTLTVWDTTVGRNVGSPVFPDGRYQLRLRVVRQDYNYDEFFTTSLTISNDRPTPTPVVTVTQAAPLPTVPVTVQETPGLGPGGLPTLTPFPTPSPQPTPADAPFVGAAGRSGSVSGPGLFQQLQSINTERFRAAFWQGVMGSGLAFGALALYLVTRGIARRVWRFIAARVWQ